MVGERECFQDDVKRMKFKKNVQDENLIDLDKQLKIPFLSIGVLLRSTLTLALSSSRGFVKNVHVKPECIIWIALIEKKYFQTSGYKARKKNSKQSLKLTTKHLTCASEIDANKSNKFINTGT